MMRRRQENPPPPLRGRMSAARSTSARRVVMRGARQESCSAPPCEPLPPSLPSPSRGEGHAMTRRAVVALLGGAALAPPLGARARERVLRVGMATIVPRTAPSIAAFVDRMAELGYRDGVDFALEHVPVAGIDDYARAFRALAAQHVDIMVAFGNEIAASAARDAAEGRPIVLLAL